MRRESTCTTRRISVRIAADHRIELARLGFFDQIDGIFLRAKIYLPGFESTTRIPHFAHSAASKSLSRAPFTCNRLRAVPSVLVRASNRCSTL